MNLTFPYWDFLFTLIYSLSLGRWVTEGITATFITIAMLVFAVMFSELIHRRTFCGRQANSTPLHALETSGLQNFIAVEGSSGPGWPGRNLDPRRKS
jgi:hypothetical protein